MGDQDETCFELLTSHEKGKNGEIHVRLPNIVVKLNEKLPFKAEALTPLLKVDGWSVPSYRLPKNLENVSVLRMVVKENFSADMVDLFMDSMKNAIKKLTEDKVTAGSNEIGAIGSSANNLKEANDIMNEDQIIRGETNPCFTSFCTATKPLKNYVKMPGLPPRNWP